MKATSKMDVDAFKVHLGLLGIVVDVTLQTVPLMKLTMKNELKSDSILIGRTIPEMASKFDVFQFWWFPNSDEIVTASGNFVSASTPGNAPSNFMFNEMRFGIANARATFEFLASTRNTMALESFAEFGKRPLHTEVVGKPPIYAEDGEVIRNSATGIP